MRYLQTYHHYRLLGAAILAVVLSPTVWADNVQARLNQNEIYQNQPVILTIETDGQASQPDLSALRQDFAIQSTSSSQSIQMINGHTSRQMRWQIVLLPKRSGDLTVAPLQVGQEKTPELRVHVKAGQASVPSQFRAGGKSLSFDSKSLNAVDENAEVSISAQLSDPKKTFYPFESIRLTVRIESNQTLYNAGIIPPSGDFSITPDGEDRQSDIRKGKALIHVYERDYIIKAQKSGELTIAPFELQGQIITGNSRRWGAPDFSDFDAFFQQSMGGGIPDLFTQAGEPFKVQTKPIKLDIAKNPAGDSWFLPAKNVQLQSVWLNEQNQVMADKPTLTVGEGARRVVILQALGADKEQLPSLSFDDIDGAKIYVDSDETSQQNTPQDTMAVRQVVLSVVPTQGGKLTLPEVKVDWFNTEKNAKAVASLPAETLTVIGGAVQNNAANPSPTPSTPAPQTEPTQAALTTSSVIAWYQNPWILGGTGTGILLLLMLVYLFVRQGKKVTEAYQQSQEQTAPATKSSVDVFKQQQQKIEHYRAENNDKALYQALLQLKTLVEKHANDWPAEKTHTVKIALQTAMQPLEIALFYQEYSAGIDDAKLDNALKTLWQILQQTNRGTQKRLPPLYK
ncbi:BatD family protein [Suttonella ornithocola]|uniref:Protein BatD n=1 Tax=Suttonella ornithocola TaxID=279832 RepID=A0A380MZ74_9GAMM|nr:BatD family protein [Suttonella ornithocola]SUO96981.1 Uncharacterised protein [Suttonella ornithocola]